MELGLRNLTQVLYLPPIILLQIRESSKTRFLSNLIIEWTFVISLKAVKILGVFAENDPYLEVSDIFDKLGKNNSSHHS